MNEFIIKETVNSDMLQELENIGFDKSYAHKAAEKYDYHNLKIFGLTLPQVNILKQTALSSGTDCATHRDVITGKIEISDCILTGSTSQLKKIAQKLKQQPFSLSMLGDKIEKFLQPYNRSKTQIVGVLNITENSFSDGGMYFDTDKACSHLLKLIEDGADIIDIGAESTKPFSTPVPPREQSERLLPVLEFVRRGNINIPISIDTRSAEVAEKCINAGASIINDVSGLEYDEKMVDVVAHYGVKVVIQHTKGTPENMQTAPVYDNLIDEIYLNLKKRVEYALYRGVKPENIIIDPGIGFGKTRNDNFEIIKRIEEFYGLKCPVMLGISRKSLLDMQDCDNFTKDVYTLALNALAVARKVDYLRVHNVKLHKTLLTFDI